MCKNCKLSSLKSIHYFYCFRNFYRTSKEIYNEKKLQIYRDFQSKRSKPYFNTVSQENNQENDETKSENLSEFKGQFKNKNAHLILIGEDFQADIPSFCLNKNDRKN